MFSAGEGRYEVTNGFLEQLCGDFVPSFEERWQSCQLLLHVFIY